MEDEYTTKIDTELHKSIAGNGTIYSAGGKDFGDFMRQVKDYQQIAAARREQVKSRTTLTDEEYERLMSLLADLAIKDKNVLVCNLYWELNWANEGYKNSKVPSLLEEQIWNIGTKGNDEALELAVDQNEYENIAVELANLALKDENKQAAELYFSLKERAERGNGYPINSALSKAESKMIEIIGYQVEPELEEMIDQNKESTDNYSARKK